jgi:hypothetical protein
MIWLKRERLRGVRPDVREATQPRLTIREMGERFLISRVEPEGEVLAGTERRPAWRSSPEFLMLPPSRRSLL